MSSVVVNKATYQNIPVYEIKHKDITVMRRQSDSYLNATQILRVADFDKSQRARILEKDVLPGPHEKVVGGFGKYQGTWVPFEKGVALAKTYSVYSLLCPIFEYVDVGESPPPLAVPPLSSKRAVPDTPMPAKKKKQRTSVPEKRPVVASKPHPSPPKKARVIENNTINNNPAYAKSLLQHFISNNPKIPPLLVNPPRDLDANLVIDEEGHTCLHWAAATGRTDIFHIFINMGADIHHINHTGQTALMRSVLFKKNLKKKTFPSILSALKDTLYYLDYNHQSVFHHAVSILSQKGKMNSSRYYTRHLLDILQHASFLDIRDVYGETALSIASKVGHREIVGMLLRAGANPACDQQTPVRQTLESHVEERSARLAKQLLITHDQKRLFGLLAGGYEHQFIQQEKLLQEKQYQLATVKSQLAMVTQRCAEYTQFDDKQLVQAAEHNLHALSKVLRRQQLQAQKERLLNFDMTMVSDPTQTLNALFATLKRLQDQRKQDTERLLQLQLRLPSEKHRLYKRIIAMCSNAPYDKVDLIVEKWIQQNTQSSK